MHTIAACLAKRLPIVWAQSSPDHRASARWPPHVRQVKSKETSILIRRLQMDSSLAMDLVGSFRIQEMCNTVERKQEYV